MTRTHAPDSPCPSLPAFGPNQRIGLFGGTFNPAHAGHRHVALTAIKSLQLDWLWVLVTPGNPLKASPRLSTHQRMKQLSLVMQNPKIILTNIEERASLHFTLETIRFLRTRAPSARFVWVMGADNLLNFHLWRGWELIANLLPMAIVERKEGRFAALNSKTAQRFSSSRRPSKAAPLLPFLKPPAWVFLHGKHIFLSSSTLRKTGNIEILRD
jgi:nicotinate-nucleotide adenylyltransferase